MLVVNQIANEPCIIGDTAVCVKRNAKMVINGPAKVVRGNVVTRVLIEHGFERIDAFTWKRNGMEYSIVEAWKLCNSTQSSDS